MKKSGELNILTSRTHPAMIRVIDSIALGNLIFTFSGDDMHTMKRDGTELGDKHMELAFFFFSLSLLLSVDINPCIHMERIHFQRKASGLPVVPGGG